MFDIEAFNDRLSALEKRIDDWIQIQVDLKDLERETLIDEMARVTALTSVVRELALNAGLTDKTFVEGLMRRAHYFRSYYRRVLTTDAPEEEDKDDGTTDWTNAAKGFPPLFPS